MSNYVRDEDGKFIPASQRPDGTWRKARRVKDGYVPQEEVPLYESKGKQFTRKPDLPVGMSPQMAKEAQDRRAKLLQKQNAAAAAAASASAAAASASASASASSPNNNQHQQHPNNQHHHHNTNAPAAVRKPANAKSKSTASAAGPASASATTSLLASATQSMATISLKSEEEVQKQLKKLRKKIREIEAIEERLSAGELKTPEQDQLDKVARKAEHLRQIAKLEKL